MKVFPAWYVQPLKFGLFSIRVLVILIVHCPCSLDSGWLGLVGRSKDDMDTVRLGYQILPYSHSMHPVCFVLADPSSGQSAARLA